MTIDEARVALEEYLAPFRPIKNDYKEMIKESALEYVSDLRGRISSKPLS